MSGMGAYVIVEAKPGRADEVAALLQRMAAVAAQDDGTLAWTAHHNPREPDSFFIYERYRDKEAFRRHRSNERLNGLGAELRELVISMTVAGGDVLPAGGPDD